MANDGLRMKYFVLNPTKRDTYGKASRNALFAYADTVQDENTQLADDIRLWVGRLTFEEPLDGESAD